MSAWYLSPFVRLTRRQRKAALKASRDGVRMRGRVISQFNAAFIASRDVHRSTVRSTDQCECD